MAEMFEGVVFEMVELGQKDAKCQPPRLYTCLYTCVIERRNLL